MNNELRLRAIRILQNEIGDNWQAIAQSLGTENLRQRVGKELTSFMGFPDRGEGGNSSWLGNCSPKVVEAVVQYVMDSKRYYEKMFRISPCSILCRVVVHPNSLLISWVSDLFCMILIPMLPKGEAVGMRCGTMWKSRWINGYDGRYIYSDHLIGSAWCGCPVYLLYDPFAGGGGTGGTVQETGKKYGDFLYHCGKHRADQGFISILL